MGRVELVRWGSEHFDDLIRLSADPRIVEYVGDGKPWTTEYATERHHAAIRHWDEYGYGWHAAIVDGEFVGLGSMRDRGEEGIEIGWWVDPRHWGKGIATRMAERLRDMALARKPRVGAGYQDDNGASERIMIKIGMTYQRSYELNGRMQHIYALQREPNAASAEVRTLAGMTEVLRYSAFTTDPAGGNPAGVVLDASGLTDDAMLAIAAEVGYSETAFAIPAEDRAYDVRYFSPLAEVPFCGHATIATSVALAERLGPGPLTFRTPAGVIDISTTGTTASLTSVPTSSSAADPALVENALKALRWTEIGDHPVHVGYAGARHLLIPAVSRERLADLDYDFEALKNLMHANDLTTVHLFWRESPELVHARDPFPVGGVVEDPATGAAAAAFGGYLRDLEGPQRFVISQGEDMGRPSRLEVDATRADRRVTVTGAAVVIDE